MRGARPGDAELMGAVEGLIVLQRWADAKLAEVLVDVTEATGEELLAREGLSGPDEMSKTARSRWRAQTKSIVAHELQIATGWGIQDCHDRVGFAIGPKLATAVPWRAWESGEVQWNQVRAWWSTCREMPVEVAAQVATRTFGPDSDRVESARNGNIDPDDMARAGFGETKDALARLVAALLGEDPKEARKKREGAVARRGASAEVVGDGTGSLTVTGRTTSVVAAMDRIDRVARALRAAGDARTLAQLRSDIALSLLLHGTTSPAPATDAGGKGSVTGEETSSASTGEEAAPAADHDGRPPPGPRADGDVLEGLDEGMARILSGTPRVNLEVIVPLDALVNADSAGVGMIPGHGYLSAEELREVASSAGGVLHRLVTDPVDGRLVERTSTTYRPDAALRKTINAADVFCRAPGCLVPAANCDFDHEVPYAQGGPTSERNGDLKHDPHHQLKTWDVWRTVLDATRRVTWTTLFGRCYTTRAFDYRLLTEPWTTSARAGTDADSTSDTGSATGNGSATGGGGPDPLAEARERWAQAVGGDADLQDRLIYAALAHRGPGDRLAGSDDYPDPEAREIGIGWLHHQAPIQLRHQTRRGQRRKGPASDQPTPEDILGITQEQAGPGVPGDEPPPF
ncbi:HNH endonuclease signature motif containing protein [Ornithinicoccus hortensis]|nr:HNH endonuclease signature motif containing protein [Ornithinicoccus hortensis]